jgi:hypothetical protein
MDGDHKGAFTEQLLQVWNHAGYTELREISRGNQGAHARHAVTTFLHARIRCSVRDTTAIECVRHIQKSQITNPKSQDPTRCRQGHPKQGE